MEKISPMMQQYFEIKEKYKDYILFFRLGDFYEMFFDDAKLASKELELTLTGKDCGGNGRAPMCGVPYHSYESYVAKLIDKGYKIAMCEQVESPAEAKGIVKREVVRVITPGTVIESSMLSDEKNNFIAGVFTDNVSIGLCFIDISTGEIYITDIDGQDIERKLMNELSSFAPREILINTEVTTMKAIQNFMRDKLMCVVNVQERSNSNATSAIENILKHFNSKSLSEVGFENDKLLSVLSLEMLFDYLQFTHKTDINHLRIPNFYRESQFMNIDIAAKRSLEITENIRTQEKKKSLLGIIDKTKTPMGKRLIIKYIEQPLINPVLINERLDAVQELTDDSVKRIKIIDSFSGIFDIERLLTKIVFMTITPRELKSLSYTIQQIPNLKSVLNECESKLLKDINCDIDTLDDILFMIDDSIEDDPPALMKDGGYIKDNYNSKIDELRDILKNSKNYLAQIENQQREETGIKNLKIGYNKIFGYYIEVTKSFMDKVPEKYIRKQTLANCERYIIEELKTLEEKILQASSKVIELEFEIYKKIVDSVSDNMIRIQKTAIAISRLDVVCSFASIAAKNHYCRPLVDFSDVIDIKEGRHPIVESVLIDLPFVANDIKIDMNENKISVITGPNMAGKSTYMRQVALIVLMAQMGSFVPASYAHIGIVDGIYTRVGASDDLSSGQSTFMVEMNEVAYILKNSTKRSLVILDEVGRGTSTYDGMSIARAIIEYMADENSNGGKTLFATHYHELSDMAREFKNIKNFSVAVRKNGDEIAFLHRIVPKSADKSYGLEVAKLAGIPQDIIDNAKKILEQLESEKMNTEHFGEYDVSQIKNSNSRQNGDCPELLCEINKIDPEVLSPLEALNIVYKLKTIAKNISIG